MSEFNAQELIDRAQRGDRDALNALVKGWYQIVWARLYCLSRDTHCASDITQDVFVAFCRTKPFCDPRFHDAQMLQGWLLTVANRLWQHFLCNPRQRGQNLTEAQLAELIGLDVEPCETIEQNEFAARLWMHIGNLPTNYQEAIKLHVQEGLTLAQMAERLGLPVGTLRWRVFRARALLLERISTTDSELLEWLSDILGKDGAPH